MAAPFPSSGRMDAAPFPSSGRMDAAPFPSSGRMDAWPERRGLQTMNLRSVFTAEQQRILERYYDNGMTNQSKACFQLILQCAQETKLDFSVVRTWVGNKRRKLASRADQNGGGLSHSMSNQGLAGGLLPNHSLAGGALSNHHSLTGGVLVAGAMLTAEMAAARNIQNRRHLAPSSTSFPATSSTSSSTSSSPLGAGNNNNSSSSNNNDVILTGIYSLNSASRPRPRPVPLPSHSDSELSSHAHSSLLGLSLHNRNTSSTSPLHSKLASFSRRPPALSSSPAGHPRPSGPSVYTPARKGGFPLGEAGPGGGPGPGAGVVPHSWARQYGTAQARSWPSSSSSSQTQPQVQPRPHSNPQPHPPAPPPRPRVSLSLPVQNPRPSSSDYTPRIQQVFTLSDRPDAGGLRQGLVPARRVPESRRSPDPSGYFSIAMETGDEEDEWRREEELANMSAQRHTHRAQRSASLSPARVDLSGVRGGHTSPVASSRPGPNQSNMALPHGSYSVTAQTSPRGESSTQTSVSVTAAPWFLNNSRKRTLQDRTQFSDRDLLQLKRYWDRGMTSLGSVCREKIAAAADQLNVDSEIVKTWISNRRRKYRLMGIEIPAPKGGPAVFTTSSPGRDSPVSPDGDGLRTPEFGDDLNDGGSLCLSEDGNNDSYQRDLDEDGTDVSTNAAPLDNNVKIEIIDEDDDGDDDDGGGGVMVASNMEQMQSLLEFKKIEIIDEDEDDDDGGDDGGGMVASTMEQMQSLLEFKHEEVQFLESELQNQKLKYQELEAFTSSLLHAVRNNDLHKQQELLASLPQPPDMDWDEPLEEGEGEEREEEEDGAQPVHAATETSSNHDEASMTATANGEQSSSPLPAPAEDFPVVTVINEEDGSPFETTQPSASEELPEETDGEIQ